MKQLENNFVQMRVWTDFKASHSENNIKLYFITLILYG